MYQLIYCIYGQNKNWPPQHDKMVLMFQKEVANRIMASPKISLMENYLLLFNQGIDKKINRCTILCIYA
jgi:16S rRNA A1518/A1519 N6-dimethyltransferase RsmA/KsgA/DIM1 with predicted DNA glycosylase/AP lyase activity